MVVAMRSDEAEEKPGAGRWVSRTEASHILRCSGEQVRRYAERGDLTGRKVPFGQHGMVIYKRSEVEALAARRAEERERREREAE